MPRSSQGLNRIAVIAALQLAGFASAAAAELSPQSRERIDSLAERFLEPNASPAPAPPPSISIVIGGNDRLLLARAYGEAHAGIPATEQTVYDLSGQDRQHNLGHRRHALGIGEALNHANGQISGRKLR